MKQPFQYTLFGLHSKAYNYLDINGRAPLPSSPFPVTGENPGWGPWLQTPPAKDGLLFPKVSTYFRALLYISLILTAFVVNADTPKTTTSQVTYRYYHSLDELERYHRLLPSPAPEGLSYHGRMRASANIDDTPQKENIVLIIVDPEPRTFSGNPPDFSNWSQAFLLITDAKSHWHPKQKELFKLFDTGTHPLEVPAKVIELHDPPSGFKQPTDVSFRLVDVTGDGTLDVWVESAHGVALISFENGEFKEVFSRYTVTREKLVEAFDVEYYWYDVRFEPEGQKYHHFLATPAPEESSYCTRMSAIANIDNTPEKENIVLMVLQAGDEWRTWVQAFLLITDTQTDGVPKKKDLFKLFDAGTHDIDVPGKTIDVQSAPFVLRGWTKRGSPWAFKGVSFDLVDLTGDGILDVWLEHSQGVAVISFQNGEFKEVCSAYTSVRAELPGYIDLDNDGIYEIKVPDHISISGAPGAAGLEWMSLYEWNGNTYVLNNRRFYTENDEFFLRLLEEYNFWHRYIIHEVYSFYIGLAFYYRSNVPMAQKYLQWVAENAENDRYIHAAEDLLKKLTPH